jgi:uncharacterized protein YjbJ (UPF0337 family)
MNRDITEGKFDQFKGKVKQSVGEALGNDKLANSGTVDQVKGAAREAWGNAKDAAGAASADASANAEAHKHDVRAKITSTAQNVKDAVNAKAEDIKVQHKRSA